MNDIIKQDSLGIAQSSEAEEHGAKRSSAWGYIKNALFKDTANDDLRDQLEEAVGHNGQPSTSFSEQERMMIANILRYGALRVEDVMVPRADIQAIDENATLEELLVKFQQVGHSRLPVYHDTLDDPTGMVHVKDLLSWISDHRANEKLTTQETVGLKVIAGGMDPASTGTDNVKDVDLDDYNHAQSDFSLKIKQTKLLRKVLFVPPSMPVMNLLLRMQSTRVHLALVVDEYGGTDGLVSIEDLVEEVVGEIEDEHDEDNGKLMSGTLEKGIIASARLPIEELEQELNIDLFANEERDDDIDTLGGLVFSLAGRIPVRGEVITHPSGLEIEGSNCRPPTDKNIENFKKIVIPK